VPGIVVGEVAPTFRGVCLEHLPRFAAPDLPEQMATATVKWFCDETGFGFIPPDDPGKDLFVYSSGVAGGGFRSLAEGAKVSYDAAQGPRGTERRERADDLTPVGYSHLWTA
jgi:CspA family cold shock protein